MAPRIYSEFRKVVLLNNAKEKSVLEIKRPYLIISTRGRKQRKVIPQRPQQNLEQILTYGEGIKEDIGTSENIIFIGPRIGTISPWSSRASDIIQHCGIDILRIERIKTVSFVTSKFWKTFISK